MGVIVVEHAIIREPGKLYFINKDGDLCEAEMKNSRKKKKAVEEKKDE